MGETVIYSGNGYAIQTEQRGDKDYLVVDRFTTDTVGQVRLYGSWGLDIKGKAAEVHFAAPKGYHLENTDARYNTVSNDRLRKAGDADFTGKSFYYVKKDDGKAGGQAVPDEDVLPDEEVLSDEPDMPDEEVLSDEPDMPDEDILPDEPVLPDEEDLSDEEDLPDEKDTPGEKDMPDEEVTSDKEVSPIEHVREDRVDL